MSQLAYYVGANPSAVSKVVEFNEGIDKFFCFDFTADNKDLDTVDFGDQASFTHYIDHTLQKHDCRFGIGGYMEHRAIYKRSALFNTEEEPRRLHLGIDFWAPAGTAVYSPLDGKVHSFADNNHFGDYGPTIILEHCLDGLTVYSLYGHLSRKSLDGLHQGKTISSGQKIATLGEWAENGSWPPHLHFQLMFDMQGMAGDFPGVGRFSEKEIQQQNIPDPAIILQIPQATIMR
ncbi:peptidoglycan DD-metalloendopeptidase family protein [Mucilaginibacter ginkgonis]|nr:peptidoglycan DD-metalloendopeptidase family protein [Mucilaginibacter ginkgonis]